MPDLPGRTKREDELRAAVLIALGNHQPQWSSGLDPAGMQRDLRDSLAPILARSFADSANVTAKSLDIGMGGIEQAGGAWSSMFAGSLAFGVNASLWRNFQGLGSLADRADLVKAVMDSPRWGTLAATEITRAATAGSEYVGASSIALRGMFVTTSWYTVDDARVCPICAPLNGVDRDTWGSMFPQGSPAHGNCRCYLDYSYVKGN